MKIEASYTLDFKPSAGIRETMNSAARPRGLRASTRAKAEPSTRGKSDADLIAELPEGGLQRVNSKRSGASKKRGRSA